MDFEYGFNLNILPGKTLNLVATPSAIHKKLPFYVESVGRWPQGEGFYTKRKDMPVYILIFTIEGEGIIEYRGEKITVTKNHVFVLDGKESHLYYTSPNKSWDTYYMHFKGNSAKDYFDMLYEENSFNTITVPHPEVIENIINAIGSLIQSPHMVSGLKTSSLVSQLLTEIIDCNISNSIKQDNNLQPSWIWRVLDFIQNNYNSKISIQKLADEYFISPSHFIKVFKQYTGCSPYEYIINYRINEAKKLLINSTETMEEIAFRSGFCSPSLFSKKFKEVTGKTPNKFRQML